MENRRKRRFKRLCWLLAALALLILILVLFFYRPVRYNPPKLVNDKHVSPYLTHELSPQLYNGTQLDEPFNVVITQAGINDIAARAKWPRKLEGLTLSAPAVLFMPDTIVLMATAVTRGAEFVLTVELNPIFDQQGLLNLQMTKVKIGAVNITPAAGIMTRKIYLDRLAAGKINPKDIRAQIAASVFVDKPFDPVFKIGEKKVRAEKITITPGKLTVRLSPVYN